MNKLLHSTILLGATPLLLLLISFSSCNSHITETKEKKIRVSDENLEKKLSFKFSETDSELDKIEKVLSISGKNYSSDSLLLEWLLDRRENIPQNSNFSDSIWHKFKQPKYTDVTQQLYIYSKLLALGDDSSFQKLNYLIHFRMENLYWKLNQFSRSIFHNKKAILLAEKLNNPVLKFDAYSRLVGLYHRQQKLDSAQIYLQKSIELLKNLPKNKNVADYYNTLGDMARENKNYRAAIKLHKEALTYKNNVFWSYTSLGKCYYAINQIDSAKLYFNKVVDSSHSNHTISLAVISKNMLAKIYRDEKQTTKALEFAYEAYVASKSTSFLELQKQCASTLYELYKTENKVGPALTILEDLTQLNDTLDQLMNDHTLNEMEFKVKEEQLISLQKVKEEKILKENIEAEARLEKSQFQIKISIVILIFIFALLLFISYSIIKIRRQKRLLEKTVQEKEMLLHELHHRVKNNLQIIISLLKVQSRKGGNKSMEEILELSQSRIKTMAILHEKLYKSENSDHLSLETYITELCHFFEQSLDLESKNISISAKLDQNEIPLEQLIPFGLIINELVTNSVKYAFPDHGGKIEIEFKKLGDKSQFIYHDSGIGLPPDFKTKMQQSMGLQLVEGLTRQVKGKLQIENKNGAEFVIIFNPEKS